MHGLTEALSVQIDKHIRAVFGTWVRIHAARRALALEDEAAVLIGSTSRRDAWAYSAGAAEEHHDIHGGERRRRGRALDTAKRM